MLRVGCPRRHKHNRYGKWRSFYVRFRRWTEQGVWDALPETLVELGLTYPCVVTTIGEFRSGDKISSIVGTGATDELEDPGAQPTSYRNRFDTSPRNDCVVRPKDG